MLARLLIVFTIVPIAELAILIPLGQWMGLGPTVALVICTGIAGAALAKRQGLAAWRRLRGELAEGGLPGDTLLDGLAVLIAGAFLITPGVLTDIAGMVLLVPPLRAPLKSYLERRLKKSLKSGSVTFMSVNDSFGGDDGPLGTPPPFDRSSSGDDDTVIDVTPEATTDASNGDHQRIQ